MPESTPKLTPTVTYKFNPILTPGFTPLSCQPPRRNTPPISGTATEEHERGTSRQEAVRSQTPEEVHGCTIRCGSARQDGHWCVGHGRERRRYDTKGKMARQRMYVVCNNKAADIQRICNLKARIEILPNRATHVKVCKYKEFQTSGSEPRGI